MSRRRRLRSDGRRVEPCLLSGNARLDDMDLTVSVTVLDIREQTLHFLVACGDGHVGELRAVDMLHVLKLSN